MVSGLVVTSSNTFNVYMTENQNTTSDVLANITELVFPVRASSRYFIEGDMKIGCNNTGGMAFAVTTPTGSTYTFQVFADSTSTTTVIRSNAITTDGTITATVNAYNAASGRLKMKMDITTSTTAGNVQLQFKSITNGQQSTIYESGTFLKVTKRPL